MNGWGGWWIAWAMIIIAFSYNSSSDPPRISLVAAVVKHLSQK